VIKARELYSKHKNTVDYLSTFGSKYEQMQMLFIKELCNEKVEKMMM